MKRPITVVQLTDPHLFADPHTRLLNVPTRDSLTGVLEHISARAANVDLLLATGDITQDGSAAAHQHFLQLASAHVSAPIAGLPGNHDTGAAFREVWQERAEPVIDIGNWRLILLDSRLEGSNGGELAPDQLDLLRKAAAGAGERHVLVALHHNPVPCGSAWLDTMMVTNAEALFTVLRHCTQVRALLWGHIHQQFDRSMDLSPGHVIRLLATPSTSVQFRPHRPAFSLDTLDPGYRLLRLHENGELETEVLRVPGLGLQPAAQSKGY